MDTKVQSEIERSVRDLLHEAHAALCHAHRLACLLPNNGEIRNPINAAADATYAAITAVREADRQSPA